MCLAKHFLTYCGQEQLYVGVIKSETKSGIRNGKIWKSVGLCQTFNTHEEAFSLCISYFVFCILCNGEGGKPCIDYTWSSPQLRLSASSIPRGRPEIPFFCPEMLNYKKNPRSNPEILDHKKIHWGRPEIQLFLPRNFKPQEIVHSKQKSNTTFEIIYLVEPVPIFQFNGTFWYNHSSIFGLNICIFIQFSFSAALCASKISFFLLPSTLSCCTRYICRELRYSTFPKIHFFLHFVFYSLRRILQICLPWGWPVYYFRFFIFGLF